MLYKLQNGKLITPPKIGSKLNGETVSGYNAMSEEALRAEGWKGLEIDTPPEEIAEGYELVWFYEQDDTTIYHKCKLEKLPEPEIVEDDIIEEGDYGGEA